MTTAEQYYGSPFLSDLFSAMAVSRDKEPAAYFQELIRQPGRMPSHTSLLAFASEYVIDPMGFVPTDVPYMGSVFSQGDLAYILQNTPAADIAARIVEIENEMAAQAELHPEIAHIYENSGRVRGDVYRTLYGYIARPPEPGTEQEDVPYPLAPPGPEPETPAPPGPGEEKPSAIDVLVPQLRTGQRDVKLYPNLVSSLMTARETGSVRKRQYKGGTKVSGLLGSLKLGKTLLGG